MAQRLRALPAFPEDRSSLPSPHIRGFTTVLALAPRDLPPFFWPLRASGQAHWYIHKNKNKVILKKMVRGGSFSGLPEKLLMEGNKTILWVNKPPEMNNHHNNKGDSSWNWNKPTIDWIKSDTTTTTKGWWCIVGRVPSWWCCWEILDISGGRRLLLEGHWEHGLGICILFWVPSASVLTTPRPTILFF